MTTEQAQELIKILKKLKDADFTLGKIDFYVKNIELEADDQAYKDILLMLDLSVSKKQSKRTTMQLRANKSVHLLRNDFFNVHTNPPFDENKAPHDEILRQLMQKYSNARLGLDDAHLHVYIEGYDAKWAFPIGEFDLTDKNNNFLDQIRQFCRFCNIKIRLERTLF